MSLDYKHANDILTNKNSNTLWLGDFQAAEDIEWLRKNNIRVVITAAAGLDNVKFDPSVRHYRYPLQDIKTENMLQYFDEVTQKIDKGLKWGSVLVHCGAGVSRSATLVIAYLIKYKKMTFLEALKYTKSKRPQICPNLGFELQLKKFASESTTKSFNLLGTRQNFYIPLEINLKTPINSSQLGQHFLNRKKNNLIKQRLTQPKGWRISYTLKPQFIASSIDPKNQTQTYLKNIAKFRFGQTNTSKWGIK